MPTKPSLRHRPAPWLLALTIGLAGCSSESSDDNDTDAGGLPDVDPGPDTSEPGPPPDPATPLDMEYSLTPAATPRLTSRQFENAIKDLFGPDTVVPQNIEPDLEGGGLLQVGAAAATISPRGVERYEAAAYRIAAQVLSPERRATLVDCEPSAVRDDTCARSVLQRIATRAWRRAVSTEEVDALVEVSGHAAEVLGDFHSGLEYGLAAVIQSPGFLFRVEIGEPDPANPERYVFNDYELASRLSFLLWNTIPDQALLDAAAAGELRTDAGLFAQATRLLEDPRSREGLLVFFDELYGLHRLSHVVKDPTVFTSASPDLVAAARQETLLTLADIVFDREADFREVLTSRRTFVNRRLAALYDVRAPAAEGFAPTEIPAEKHRTGLLGHASILSLYAHSTATSATLRGKFIRTVMLCGEVPPPPSGVDTSIPEPDGTAVTLRERVAVHLEVEDCAGCHALMDPLGLALENFDGLGAWRETEFDAPIDPSGDLDGEPFSNVDEFVNLLAADPRFTDCVVERFVRYANSSVETWDQADQMEPLKDAFEAQGFRFQQLVLHVIMSPAFRYTGAPQ
jgi:hypothetical protein